MTRAQYSSRASFSGVVRSGSFSRQKRSTKAGCSSAGRWRRIGRVALARHRADVLEAVAHRRRQPGQDGAPGAVGLVQHPAAVERVRHREVGLAARRRAAQGAERRGAGARQVAALHLQRRQLEPDVRVRAVEPRRRARSSSAARSSEERSRYLSQSRRHICARPAWPAASSGRMRGDALVAVARALEEAGRPGRPAPAPAGRRRSPGSSSVACSSARSASRRVSTVPRASSATERW